MLAENAAASLMFQDAKSANQLLQSLRNSPNVEIAALYTADGRLFAGYQREEQVSPAMLRGAPEGMLIRPRYLLLSQAVPFQREVPGSLVLKVDLDGLYRQTAWQILMTLVAVLLGLAVSHSLLRRLNTSILHPLDRLNALIERVSDERRRTEVPGRRHGWLSGNAVHVDNVASHIGAVAARGRRNTVFRRRMGNRSGCGARRRRNAANRPQSDRGHARDR